MVHTSREVSLERGLKRIHSALKDEIKSSFKERVILGIEKPAQG